MRPTVVLVRFLVASILLAACAQSAAPITSPPALLGDGEIALEPGTYILPFGDEAVHEFPRVILAVPEGWANLDGWLVHKNPDMPRWMAVSFWDVDRAYVHPCQWYGPKIEVGPTVDDLVAVLIDRPLRNATTPVKVMVDGYEGKQFEWSVPTDIDFADCDGDYFESWTALGWASDRYQQGPGQVDRLLILDVDGSRLVVDVMHMPGATTADLAELEQVVGSIRFER